MAVQYFQDRMSFDQQAAKDRAKQDAWDAQLELMRKEIMGSASAHQGLNFHNRMQANIAKPHSQSVKNMNRK
jgi:hypothetical protein